MPRISLEIPRTALVKANNEQDLVNALMAGLESLGDEFAEVLGITGAADIWVKVDIGGWSNKRSVFGNIYMIDKEIRTETVRNAFGDRVKETVQEIFRDNQGYTPGIDIPMAPPVPRKEYIEADDNQPEAQTAWT